MSCAAALPPPVSIAECDRFLDANRSDARSELIGGEIVAMTNSSIAHEVIVGNIGAPPRVMMHARNGFVSQGGVHVQSREAGAGDTKPRPDLMALCGPVDMRRNFITKPLVVIEVLPPGTMDLDRGLKLRFYKTALPVVQHIVLLFQDQIGVEHARRSDSGWTTGTLTAPQAALRLETLGFEVALAEIYADVEVG